MILDPGDGAIKEVTRPNQVVTVMISLILFVMLPSILKSIVQTSDPFEYAATQVESRQQRRSAFVAGIVDTLARMIRIRTTASLISWLAVGFLAILAGGTITESVSGMPVRIIVSTGVCLLLAAFAAPPVRGYLQQKLRLTFPRSIVVGVLIAGVLTNEEVVTPPVE